MSKSKRPLRERGKKKMMVRKEMVEDGGLRRLVLSARLYVHLYMCVGGDN